MKYIYLSGDVMNWDCPGCISAYQTRQLIADARAESPDEPITVVLNSFGGDVTEGIAVYNLLRASRPVDIVISGIAASIASVIAMAGDHVAMYSNSTLYVHHAWTFAEGNASQMKQRTEELEAADRVLIDAYTAKSGRTEQEIIAILDGPNGEGSSIGADRALELGLIDEILDPAQAVAARLKSCALAQQRTSAAEDLSSPAQAVASMLKRTAPSDRRTADSSYLTYSSYPKNQTKETAMSADPTLTTLSAECGGTPQKNEEVVEIEKEVTETSGDDDKEKLIAELIEKVDKLTALVEEKQAKLDAQAHFRSVVASAAQTAAAASKSWPELVKEIGFKAAAEQYPEVRKSYMKAQIARGSIR